MIFTLTEKETIGKRLVERQETSGLSQAAFARANEMSPADMSNIRGEKWKEQPHLVGDMKWIKFARLVDFTRKAELEWKTAQTNVKRQIDAQLNACKNYSFTAILCDDAGVGKTYACKAFAATNPHVYYIDCSNCRTRIRFVRAIARAVGINADGKIDDLFESAMYVLGLIDRPLLILDEAGDLEDKAFLELKRMYNNLEGQCGFYLVGADGLKKKIERGEAVRKVGFTEVFSRFGKKFTKIVPVEPEERRQFLIEMAHSLLDANGISDRNSRQDIIRTICLNGLKDLRTVKREVIKIRIKKEAC
ncbi:hypothetical protein C8N47_111110 [Mangrovibacterium marinum]|uniref:ORC1/DEAH AAA+ ATPase domain-containing protein n=1 Tax=Mangrovibacterium marinum TaxID=1639118 RepID=A0A2T5C0H8_9BACT|nr:AAA family ATPase [Mangrovibacterium marinum]PTN08070.1 hypothetical protein C8N47_111110 [Mangrovibacterium marinum]